MPKRLRREPIYIAPDILGWLDENGDPIVIDERNANRVLNPRNIDDKIFIYERQVKDWFLIPASNLIRYKNRYKGFMVFMLCLSYIEGVEQYKQGRSSHRHSREFFVASMNRIYPNRFQNQNLNEFYYEARCGLFHNGMVEGRIVINNAYPVSIRFIDNEIKVNPKLFLEEIIEDFRNYIQLLQTDPQLRDNFDHMYTNL